jgi:hypothetical protein
MLDEVEVGRHFKYSLQGVRSSIACAALVTTGMCLALTFISKLCSTLVTQSVWVLSFSHEWKGRRPHTHLFSLPLGFPAAHSLARIFQMSQEYKIHYTVIKVLSLPHNATIVSSVV